MYKNPLNNGDISDYNSLKKQRDAGAIVKKYSSKKLQTEPNELQKYYQYMTYQQPILDELNYVAERLRTEDIETQKKNFNFIEDQKIEREKRMKALAGVNKEDIAKELFDGSSIRKQEDATPTIKTELEYIKPVNNKQEEEIDDLIGSLFDGYEDKPPIKEEIFELSRTEEKVSKAKKKREGRKKAKEEQKKKEEEQKQKEEEQKQKEEQSALKIENAILSKVKRERAKKELQQLKAEKAQKEELMSAADTVPIVKKKRGRPKGSTKKKI